MIADKNTVGMPVSWCVSENGELSFSKNAKRLFFGTAPIKPAKDTTLVEIDLVKVDVWHYNDDYLQPQQLRNLDRELKRTYLAVYHTNQQKMVQLADRILPQVMMSDEGNGDQFIGITDMGKRIQGQWEGRTLKDIYSVNVLDGNRKLVKKDVNGNALISPKGKYIFWYDESAKNYFTWADGKVNNISAKVKVKLYDERFDMPDDPNPYGIVRWTENDAALLVYDRYDIWQLDPGCCGTPVNITAGEGRKTKTVYRYQSTDPEERFLKPSQDLLLRSFDETNKKAGVSKTRLGANTKPLAMQSGNYNIAGIIKARDVNVLVYTKESYTRSPNMHAFTDSREELQLSRINPQQDQYNWGTAELFNWKAYDGKDATGILYKPENYDPKKKYPLIVYFYERLSDGLYNYLPPAPTPSRLNIPFFVSRGYLVLAPDIVYTKGYPGKAGFDYVVSGARALAKKGWADSTRMGIQGQSWGGYQAAYIITRTKLFKAAWAGAPVANMTSAYGGIRWESGLNRQFQYEHSQSRIGATLWEKPNLYIENSPLFYLKNVTTPLVVMANDADGAVPWYQGIEMFTAMKRLQKKVWMLNYNGEAHNLVERKNRKDIQIREQQFFDWLLKGEKPARWITEGVPAVDKGRDWGLD
jgi:dipeptidyl aminopeptidase/acylaminoacyl peptidase